VSVWLLATAVVRQYGSDCFACNYGVVEAEVTQALVAFDAGVGQRSVFVPAEGEDSLVHVGAVEDVERERVGYI